MMARENMLKIDARATFIGLCVFVSSAGAFLVYDCNDSHVNISVISMKDVVPCPNLETGYTESRVQVSVVQKDSISNTHVKTCLVEVTRLIAHCGMHSHSSLVKGGLYSYIFQVGASACQDIHRYHSYSILGRLIGDLVMNGTTSAAITLAGSLDTGGSCEGGTYVENENEWNNVVVTATIKITTRDYRAPVKLMEDEVSLIGGVTCSFNRGYCFDSTCGEAVWNTDSRESCLDDFTILYQGNAQLIIEKIVGKLNRRYLVVEQETKIFALTLTEKNDQCGINIWKTEHPQIFVTNRADDLPVKKSSPEENINLMTYVNSKFLYVEQAYKRAINQLYRDTVHRRCLLKRDILVNRLTLAPLTPSAVGLLFKKTEGYLGKVMGEVLYIIKCIPRNAEIRRTDRCFNELPILVDNQSYFMAPVSHIMQTRGEEIECSPLTPPLYHVDGRWIGVAPTPILVDPPGEVTVEAETPMTFSPIQPISSSGLYTMEEINKAQRSLSFGTERRAVENILIRRMAGYEVSNQGYSTMNIFDKAEIEKLARSTLQKMWGWFTDIGIFFSGLMGIYIIIRGIKYILGVILNGIHLYQIFGFSCALLASIWNTLTMWLVHRHQRGRADPEIQPNHKRTETSTQPDQREPPVGPITSGATYPNLHWTQQPVSSAST